MTRFSKRSLVRALLVNVVAYFVLGSALAASKPAQNLEGLDHLIPREKWDGAGLNKLTTAEQQTLADDITSLVAGARTTESGAGGTDRSRWRKLQRHMTKDDVRNLLGEPKTVSVSRFAESWYYVGGTVTFDGKGRLDMWNEN